jgi:phosphoribosylaminoimidazole-succinocarboxamide synthase
LTGEWKKSKVVADSFSQPHEAVTMLTQEMRDLEESLNRCLLHVHSGKVRDTYELPHLALLPVVSDRISVYDFVLGFLIPDKGEILNAINIFWRLYLRGMLNAHEKLFEDDLIAFGREIDGHIPAGLRGNEQLQRRACVVSKLRMFSVELIVRGYLTGSGWEAYKETGVVCGHTLPVDLRNGEELDFARFTPTTKAHEAHDEHLNFRSVTHDHKASLELNALRIYHEMFAFCSQKGIIMADTKGEGGQREESPENTFVWGDEIGTPDCCRYWLVGDYEKYWPGKLPPSYDKQFVREWARSFGLDDKNKFDPKNPEHKAYARSLVAPPAIIKKTRELYHDIFERITGQPLRQFQKEVMGIG